MASSPANTFQEQSATSVCHRGLHGHHSPPCDVPRPAPPRPTTSHQPHHIPDLPTPLIPTPPCPAPPLQPHHLPPPPASPTSDAPVTPYGLLTPSHPIRFWGAVSRGRPHSAEWERFTPLCRSLPMSQPPLTAPLSAPGEEREAAGGTSGVYWGGRSGAAAGTGGAARRGERRR